MDKRYLVLHRALRNAGDFLIRQRVLDLFRWACPRCEILEGEAWRPIAHQFSRQQLSRASAIVIGGGPGYVRHMYPRIYPLGNLAALPPVVLLALGSFVVPGSDPQLEGFRFSAQTQAFLGGIARQAGFLGVRDRISERLLRSSGLEPVRMLGDPAWYNLETLERPVRPIATVKSLALTPPANPVYWTQAKSLFLSLRRVLPAARFTIVFHSGVERFWQQLAQHEGWSIVDISGGMHGFSLYDRQDLHVGYRVHAHLYCLSTGIPSYLIAEDSRGRGVLATLGELGATAFDASSGVTVGRRLVYVLGGTRRVRRLFMVASGVGGALARVSELGTAITRQIELDRETGWARHETARDTIRAVLPCVGKTIRDLP